MGWEVVSRKGGYEQKPERGIAVRTLNRTISWLVSLVKRRRVDGVSSVLKGGRKVNHVNGRNGSRLIDRSIDR